MPFEAQNAASTDLAVDLLESFPAAKRSTAETARRCHCRVI